MRLLVAVGVALLAASPLLLVAWICWCATYRWYDNPPK